MSRSTYQVSQKKRKRIEEVFGWMKSIGLLRKLRHRGLERVGWMFTFAAARHCNLDTLDVIPVPDRLQEAVGEAKKQ